MGSSAVALSCLKGLLHAPGEVERGWRIDVVRMILVYACILCGHHVEM